VRLAWTFDSIFELSISLGQLRHDLVSPARGIAIQDRGLQHDASSEPEFMRGLMRRNRSRGYGVHAITFRPISPEMERKAFPVETINKGKTPGWRLDKLRRCALPAAKSSKIRQQTGRRMGVALTAAAYVSQSLLECPRSEIGRDQIV
jgi:hypothetical protein